MLLLWCGDGGWGQTDTDRSRQVTFFFVSAFICSFFPSVLSLVSFQCCTSPVMRNRCSAAYRCAAEAIQVCHEIFTSHNYNHNEINNCLSCFLLCLSFNFLYYSREDRGQTRSTKWNWKVTHPSPPHPPQYAKWGWCAAMTLRQYLVCRECRKVAQHCTSQCNAPY
jgi:hypothetical protein